MIFHHFFYHQLWSLILTFWVLIGSVWWASQQSFLYEDFLSELGSTSKLECSLKLLFFIKKLHHKISHIFIGSFMFGAVGDLRMSLAAGQCHCGTYATVWKLENLESYSLTHHRVFYVQAPLTGDFLDCYGLLNSVFKTQEQFHWYPREMEEPIIQFPLTTKVLDRNILFFLPAFYLGKMFVFVISLSDQEIWIFQFPPVQIVWIFITCNYFQLSVEVRILELRSVDAVCISRVAWLKKSAFQGNSFLFPKEFHYDAKILQSN